MDAMCVRVSACVVYKCFYCVSYMSRYARSIDRLIDQSRNETKPNEYKRTYKSSRVLLLVLTKQTYDFHFLMRTEHVIELFVINRINRQRVLSLDDVLIRLL